MDMRKIKKPKKEIRDLKIEVVLNREERERIIELAKEEGLPTSTFIRWKLLKTS